MSVDLPDPDGPTIAVSSPVGNVRLTPRRASTAASPSPYRRLRSRHSTMVFAGALASMALRVLGLD
jgi:hypothetical protein